MRGMVRCAYDSRRALPVKGMFVNDGHAGGGHTLSNSTSERRTALAIEITFETMTNRFVQQDAGPARAQHNGHGAGGSGAGVEVDAGLMHGLFGVLVENVISEIAVVRRRHHYPVRGARLARK